MTEDRERYETTREQAKRLAWERSPHADAGDLWTGQVWADGYDTGHAAAATEVAALLTLLDAERTKSLRAFLAGYDRGFGEALAAMVEEREYVADPTFAVDALMDRMVQRYGERVPTLKPAEGEP